MNKVRGILMLGAGAFVLYRGFFVMPTGQAAWLARGLGLAAIALGIWHLTRKPSRRLM